MEPLVAVTVMVSGFEFVGVPGSVVVVTFVLLPPPPPQAGSTTSSVRRIIRDEIAARLRLGKVKKKTPARAKPLPAKYCANR